MRILNGFPRIREYFVKPWFLGKLWRGTIWSQRIIKAKWPGTVLSFIAAAGKAILSICRKGKRNKPWKEYVCTGICCATPTYSCLSIESFRNVKAARASYRNCSTTFTLMSCCFGCSYILTSIFFIVSFHNFPKIESLPTFWLNFLVDSFYSLLSPLNHA